ncbi:hypothetical protein [Shewanella putrefaciens]|jgi:hypothetical protein|uniref:hypothetical protein n=1 Tax=Shewanella putrefaciens TaxID=24 RepID=UPI003D7B9081
MTVVVIQEPIVFHRPIAILQVDMDSNAERLIVLNRDTFDVLHMTIRPPSGVVKCQLPSTYSTNDSLLVGILDNSLVYDCKFADGIRCEVVDSSVDMSQ